MGVFKDYSKYYNLLYKDKDYKAETEYIISLINQNSSDAKSILNLGCGTGNHDFIFSEKGYEVVGIDLSHNMIEIAKSKESSANKPVTFLQGDIRNLKLDREFDVVLSLFHVMSYQSSNEDLEQAIQTAYQHLKKGGVFIFDCWYGPGVLTDHPTNRNRDFENDDFKVNRITTPTLLTTENCVDVKFNVNIFDKRTDVEYNLEELHKMRYLFIPELIYFLNKNGFTFNKAEEWITKKELSDKSWYATIVCRK